MSVGLNKGRISLENETAAAASLMKHSSPHIFIAGTQPAPGTDYWETAGQNASSEFEVTRALGPPKAQKLSYENGNVKKKGMDGFPPQFSDIHPEEPSVIPQKACSRLVNWGEFIHEESAVRLM